MWRTSRAEGASTVGGGSLRVRKLFYDRIAYHISPNDRCENKRTVVYRRGDLNIELDNTKLKCVPAVEPSRKNEKNSPERGGAKIVYRRPSLRSRYDRTIGIGDKGLGTCISEYGHLAAAYEPGDLREQNDGRATKSSISLGTLVYQCTY